MVRYLLGLTLVGVTLVGNAQELCENTMDQLCSASEARELSALIRQVDHEFQGLRARAKYEKVTYGFCPTLAWETGDYFGSCPGQVLKSLENKIYSSERWKVANREFVLAKKAVLVLIDQKLSKIRSPEVYRLLHERRDVVANASVIFDLVKFSRRQGHFESLDSNFNPWNAFTDMKEGAVYLGGLLLLADLFPTYLRWTFAHELGHLIGPFASTAQFGENGLTGFREWSASQIPFFSEVACVQNTEPKILKRDDACFVKAIQQIRTLFTDPELNNLVELGARLVNASPIYSPTLPSLGDTKCQSDQTDEAFADWIGTVALADQIQSKAEVLEVLVPNCLAQELGDDAYDTHPLTKNRVVHILLEPRVRQILKCSPSNIPICEMKDE